MRYCKEAGCLTQVLGRSNKCEKHRWGVPIKNKVASNCIEGSPVIDYSQKQSLAVLYPKYYKAVPKDWDSMDTYAVNILFPVDDPSGCILHARKKLLVPGVRSGGKSMRKDITEARDTLNRWLELNPE